MQRKWPQLVFYPYVVFFVTTVILDVRRKRQSQAWM